MTLANLTSAIQRLDAINPLDEYAYENALLADLTINQLVSPPENRTGYKLAKQLI
jgi:hypothetical protein